MRHIYFWADTTLYIGEDLSPSRHCHGAIECAVALSGELQLHLDGRSVETCAAATIPAGVAHKLECPGGQLALLYLEHEAADCQRVLPRENHCLSKKKINNAMRIRQLLRGSASPPGPEVALQLRRLIVDALALRESLFPHDPRVNEVAKIISQASPLPVQVAALSSGVHLSMRRLQHLFGEQVGMPIRRYALWRRLRWAMAQHNNETHLTEIAHAAGFADSAHFSRTCRAMLGIAPSSAPRTKPSKRA